MVNFTKNVLRSEFKQRLDFQCRTDGIKVECKFLLCALSVLSIILNVELNSIYVSWRIGTLCPTLLVQPTLIHAVCSLLYIKKVQEVRIMLWWNWPIELFQWLLTRLGMWHIFTKASYKVRHLHRQTNGLLSCMKDYNYGLYVAQKNESDRHGQFLVLNTGGPLICRILPAN